MELTQFAREGYEAPSGARRPYLATSDAADAWELGHDARRIGCARPVLVRRSHGSLIRVLWADSAVWLIARVDWHQGEPSIRLLGAA